MSFRPKFEVLQPAQMQIWPRLIEVPAQFVLYGGTAIALRLGHRTSVDFDFFSTEPFVPLELRASLGFLVGSEVLQVAANTLTVSILGKAPVKLSFFGGLKLHRVGQPEKTVDGVLKIASLLDVAACKAAVIQERAEAKDYLDLWAVMKSGVSLAQILGAARTVYADQFSPMIALKAMSYFGDGDLSSLSQDARSFLTRVVSEVTEIPEIPATNGSLASDAAN